MEISKKMIMGDILKTDMGVGSILIESGMHCLGCPSSQMETLEEACEVHGIDASILEEKINKYLGGK